jgi:hypothetical protein
LEQKYCRHANGVLVSGVSCRVLLRRADTVEYLATNSRLSEDAQRGRFLPRSRHVATALACPVAPRVTHGTDLSRPSVLITIGDNTVQSLTPETTMRYTCLVLLTLLPGIARADGINASDRAAIEKTALDYIEGWYEGNAERMERSLHPELAKRIVLRDPKTGRSRLDQMSAMSLVQGTRRGGGTQTPAAKRQRDVKILDLYENAASVKVIASDWIDYLHVARFNGKWVIVNVLWELKPQ